MSLHRPTFVQEFVTQGKDTAPVDVPNWALPQDPTVPVFASLEAQDNAVGTTLPVLGTFVVLDSGFVAGPGQHTTITPSPGAKVVINTTTTANVAWSASIAGDDPAAQDYEVGVFVDGVSVAKHHVTIEPGDTVCIGGSAILELPVTSTVELKASCTTKAGTTLTCSNGFLTISGILP